MKRLIFLLLLILVFPAFAKPSHHHKHHALSHQYGGSGEGYVNSDGSHVHKPKASDSKPAEATAKCRDGTWSFSRHRRGTCSRHGGVARWV